MAGAAGNHGNFANMRRARPRLVINAVAVFAAIALLLHLRRRVERVALPVVAIDEERTFVNVRMTGDDDIDAASFKDREEKLTHLDQRFLLVGIMRALRV